MPALFCLALHPALEQLRAELPVNSHLIAYLDDIYIVCDKDDVVNVLERTRHVLNQVCHININLGKLAAWSQTPAEAPPGLERFGDNIWKSALPLEQRGLRVLGTPLGTQEFVERFCAERSEEKAQLLDLIPKLPSLQSAWLLLYFCAVPCINHLLRNIYQAYFCDPRTRTMGRWFARLAFRSMGAAGTAPTAFGWLRAARLQTNFPSSILGQLGRQHSRHHSQVSSSGQRNAHSLSSFTQQTL